MSAKLFGARVSDQTDLAAAAVGRPRVVKAPAVRRAQLIDCAQALFLAKGYEKTTINDVIAATSLSKGAFYHHFRSKEDLLEAIAERYAGQSLAHANAVAADRSLNALQQLNVLMAMTRDWKAENLPQLRAMFTTLLQPENATLYHRIVGAVFAAMAPTLTAIIAEGERQGVFDVADTALAAEAMLWLGEGRRVLVVRAMALAESGGVDEATEMIVRRVRAEEAMVDRVLGVKPGSVQLGGTPEFLRSLIVAWNAPPA